MKGLEVQCKTLCGMLICGSSAITTIEIPETYLLAILVKLEGWQHTDGLLFCHLAHLLVRSVDLHKGNVWMLLLQIWE